jgi:hypothetical protein
MAVFGVLILFFPILCATDYLNFDACLQNGPPRTNRAGQKKLLPALD